jgi:hypothetical protein
MTEKRQVMNIYETETPAPDHEQNKRKIHEDEP